MKGKGERVRERERDIKEMGRSSLICGISRVSSGLASVPVSAGKDEERRAGRYRLLLRRHIVLGHPSRPGGHFLSVIWKKIPLFVISLLVVVKPILISTFREESYGARARKFVFEGSRE